MVRVGLGLSRREGSLQRWKGWGGDSREGKNGSESSPFWGANSGWEGGLPLPLFSQDTPMPGGKGHVGVGVDLHICGCRACRVEPAVSSLLPPKHYLCNPATG